MLQKAGRIGIPAETIDARFDELGVTVSPFGRLDARLAASLHRHHASAWPTECAWAWPAAWASPAYTADRLWESWAAEFGEQSYLFADPASCLSQLPLGTARRSDQNLRSRGVTAAP